MITIFHQAPGLYGETLFAASEGLDDSIAGTLLPRRKYGTGTYRIVATAGGPSADKPYKLFIYSDASPINVTLIPR
jgi:hypothetical protein